MIIAYISGFVFLIMFIVELVVDILYHPISVKTFTCTGIMVIFWSIQIAKEEIMELIKNSFDK